MATLIGTVDVSVADVDFTLPDSLTFDLVKEEAWSHGAVLSDHPLETGAEVQDHRQRRARKFTLEAVITETPFADGLDAILNGVGIARLTDAIAWLRAHENQLFEYSGQLGTFDNVALGDWSYVKGREGHLVFQLNLQIIEFARATRVAVPAIQRPPAKPKDDKGPQSKKRRQADDETGFASILHQAAELSTGESPRSLLGELDLILGGTGG